MSTIESGSPTVRCAVVGSPIAHSLSPVMHRAAYLQLGLSWDYQAVEIPAGQLRGFLAARDMSWRGLSVTMPLKREAAELAGTASDDVEVLGVANTLVRHHETWNAHNTDVSGTIAAWKEAGLSQIRTMRVLGAGATVASVLLAGKRCGLESIEFVVREPPRAAEVVGLAQRLGIHAAVRKLPDFGSDGVDLLVNTIPTDSIRDLTASLVGSADGVFDVIYDPWPSALLTEASAADRVSVSGIDLLACQAADQVALMTGSTINPHLLRDAALTALQSR